MINKKMVNPQLQLGDTQSLTNPGTGSILLLVNRSKLQGGENFWARGYYVSTVGKDEEAVKAYIKSQESEDQLYEQRKLFE